MTVDYTDQSEGLSDLSGPCLPTILPDNQILASSAFLRTKNNYLSFCVLFLQK